MVRGFSWWCERIIFFFYIEIWKWDLWNCLSKYFSYDDINLCYIGIFNFEFINIKSVLYIEVGRDFISSLYMNVVDLFLSFYY